MNDPQQEGHMASYIERRKFLATLGGVAAAWPVAARAQQPGMLPTIGYLGSATPATQGQWVAAFVQRLRELGWIEGRTIAIEYPRSRGCHAGDVSHPHCFRGGGRPGRHRPRRVTRATG